MLAAVLLSGAALWGLVTVVNGVRLGSRHSEAAIYWSSVAIVAVLSAAAGWLAVRLVRRSGHRDG